MLSFETFDNITQEVIDRLEGGYWNPLWHPTKGMGDSGETMFGIDRKHGGTINTSDAGREFWSIIDKNKSKDVWKWNYRGGKDEKRLKDLVVRMMYPKYEEYSKKYMDPKTKEIVDSDGRLIFHFSYALWNGPGWFKEFARDLNELVKRGVTNPDALAQQAIKSRVEEGLKPDSGPNSLIKKGGLKIAGFIDEMEKYSPKKTIIKSDRPNLIPTVLITAAVVVSLVVLAQYLKRPILKLTT